MMVARPEPVLHDERRDSQRIEPERRRNAFLFDREMGVAAARKDHDCARRLRHTTRKKWRDRGPIVRNVAECAEWRSVPEWLWQRFVADTRSRANESRKRQRA